MVTTFRARPLVSRTRTTAAAATAATATCTAACAATCTAATTHRRCGRHARYGLLFTSLEQAAVVLELLELCLELGEEHLGGSRGGERGDMRTARGREGTWGT